MKDGLWGYVNRTNGEIVIDFQFSSVYGHPCFRHGYALVSNVVEGEDNSIRYDSFLIDTTGRKTNYLMDTTPLQLCVERRILS